VGWGFHHSCLSGDRKVLYKVFFVEDEIVAREGIRDNVDWKVAGFEFCGEAADGEMALPLIRAAEPDVLIVMQRVLGSLREKPQLAPSTGGITGGDASQYRGVLGTFRKLGETLRVGRSQ
jgi:hypothetical protein